VRCTTRSFLASPALYPVTACYVCAVITIMLITSGVVSPLEGCAGLAVAAVGIVVAHMCITHKIYIARRGGRPHGHW